MKLRYVTLFGAIFLILLHVNIYLHSMPHGYGNVDEHANFVWVFAGWTVAFGLITLGGFLGSRNEW